MNTRNVTAGLALWAAFAAGCWGDTGGTQMAEQAATEAQQEKLLAATPPPQLTFSLERENLKARLTRFNDPNKVSYVYLVNFGKVMAFYAIKGKVSSVNSLLTTTDQIVFRVKRGDLHAFAVDSPDLDGSYGTNGEAIFFFTTEGVYVEWRGDYMLCDQPLKLATPPEMVYQMKQEEL